MGDARQAQRYEHAADTRHREWLRRTAADALRERTDGNPFFLVEYARLAREGGDLGALLAEENPPAAVHDVLSRRIAGLPEGSEKTLRFAGVLGRQFDVPRSLWCLLPTRTTCSTTSRLRSQQVWCARTGSTG